MSEVVLDTKTSQNNSRRKKLRGKLLVALPLLVVLAVVGASGWYLVNRDVQKANDKTAATSQDKQYAQSEADLKDKLAKAQTPEDKSAAYQALANLNLERGDRAAALKDTQAAIDSNKDSYAAYATLALIKVQSGDNDGAIAAYKKAAEIVRGAGDERGARDYEIMAASVGR